MNHLIFKKKHSYKLKKHFGRLWRNDIAQKFLFAVIPFTLKKSLAEFESRVFRLKGPKEVDSVAKLK